METSAVSRKVSGWSTYSGVMLIIAAAASIFDSIWALRDDQTVVDPAAYGAE